MLLAFFKIRNVYLFEILLFFNFKNEKIWVGAELAALKEQYRHLSQVKVDKVAGLVGHVRTKVSANNAVPCWVVFLVEFLFYVCSNVLKRNTQLDRKTQE